MEDTAGKSAPREVIAQAAALRAARRVSSSSFAKEDAVAVVVAKKKRKQQDDESEEASASASASEEPDSSDEEREQRSRVTAATVKNIYTKLEELEHTVNQELKPLAYATLERLERLEATLTREGQQRQRQLAEPDYHEGPGHREREVVTGLGWGDRADRRQRRVRRVSRELY